MTLIVIFAAAAFMMNMREPKLDFYWKNIEIEEENVFVITFPLKLDQYSRKNSGIFQWRRETSGFIRWFWKTPV